METMGDRLVGKIWAAEYARFLLDKLVPCSITHCRNCTNWNAMDAEITEGLLGMFVASMGYPE